MQKSGYNLSKDNRPEEKENQPVSDTIRLNRFLAQCGLGARRKCDEIIKSGNVYVNGKKITELGMKISLNDKVEYHGKAAVPVRLLEYYAYHKPPGIMVTKLDPLGRTTAFQALLQGGFGLYAILLTTCFVS